MRSARPADPGWATGAGVFGILAAAGTLSLTIGSEATKEDKIPAIPLGASATALVAIGGPITAVGAASARRGGDVEGAVGLRIVGWVGYGLMLIDSAVLLGLGVNEIEPPDGVIVSVGAIGAISLLSFAGDAFFSASEAADEAALETASPAPSLTAVPALSWVRTRDGALAPVLGAQGTF